MSAPYMLHLQPVIIPSTAPDIRASEVFNSDDLDYVYKSVEDGMEHIFTSTTQL
jgi:anaphase-promoting complex subunit 1